VDENDFLDGAEGFPVTRRGADHFLAELLHVADLAFRACHHPHWLRVRWHNGTRLGDFVKGKYCPDALSTIGKEVLTVSYGAFFSEAEKAGGDQRQKVPLAQNPD
jgi:hypothetical protein